MALAVVTNVAEVEDLAKRIVKIDAQALGRATIRSVNKVAERGFDESRKAMLRGVNVTDAYVKERMDVEPATEARNPTAVIVAFRPGGQRRPTTRPVNLRQFGPQVIAAPVRFQNPSGGKTFRMKDGRQATMPWSDNPRKPGNKLPFVLRTGTTKKGQYNMPVGQKAVGISVEVLRGRRKDLPYAFAMSARAGKVEGGQGLLIMTRSKSDRKGKGKAKALHSLAVWQMFKASAAKVIPLIVKDLEETTLAEIDTEIDKVLSK